MSFYGSMGDHMPPPPPEEGPLPGPGDNPHCCPVCGFAPCGADCRLGLSEYDLEEFELMWRDWTAEPAEEPAEEDADE